MAQMINKRELYVPRETRNKFNEIRRVPEKYQRKNSHNTSDLTKCINIEQPRINRKVLSKNCKCFCTQRRTNRKGTPIFKNGFLTIKSCLSNIYNTYSKIHYVKRFKDAKIQQKDPTGPIQFKMIEASVASRNHFQPEIMESNFKCDRIKPHKRKSRRMKRKNSIKIIKQNLSKIYHKYSKVFLMQNKNLKQTNVKTKILPPYMNSAAKNALLQKSYVETERKEQSDLLGKGLLRPRIEKKSQIKNSFWEITNTLSDAYQRYSKIKNLELKIKKEPRKIIKPCASIEQLRKINYRFKRRNKRRKRSNSFVDIKKILSNIYSKYFLKFYQTKNNLPINRINNFCPKNTTDTYFHTLHSKSSNISLEREKYNIGYNRNHSFSNKQQEINKFRNEYLNPQTLEIYQMLAPKTRCLCLPEKNSNQVDRKIFTQSRHQKYESRPKDFANKLSNKLSYSLISKDITRRLKTSRKKFGVIKDLKRTANQFYFDSDNVNYQSNSVSKLKDKGILGLMKKQIKKANLHECLCYSDSATEGVEAKHVKVQTGDPFFEIKLDNVDMCVLNSSDVKNKVMTLGKNVKGAKCICPSHEDCAKNILQKRSFKGGIYRRNLTKNKSTDLSCTCLKNKLWMYDDETCNKPGTNQYVEHDLATKVKPFIEVKLDADNMCIINAQDVQKKIQDFHKQSRNVYQSVGGESHSKEENTRICCKCNKLFERKNYTEDSSMITNKGNAQNDRTKQPQNDRTKQPQNDRTKQPQNDRRQQKSRWTCARSCGFHTRNLQNMQSEKTYKVHEQKDFDMKMNKNGFFQKYNKNITPIKKAMNTRNINRYKDTRENVKMPAQKIKKDNRKLHSSQNPATRSPENSGTLYKRVFIDHEIVPSFPLENCFSHNADTRAINNKSCLCNTKIIQKQNNKSEKTKQKIKNKKAFHTKHKTRSRRKKSKCIFNKHIKDPPKPKKLRCISKYFLKTENRKQQMKLKKRKEKENKKKKMKKLTKDKYSKADSHKKARKKSRIKAKNRRRYEHHQFIIKKKEVSENRKHRKKERAMLKKMEKKRKKEQRAEEKEIIKALESEEGAKQANCFVMIIGAIMSLTLKTAFGLFLILLEFIVHPKKSYHFAKGRLQDPKGTYYLMKKLIADSVRLRRLRIQKCLNKSETISILSDTIKDTPLFDMFASKGKTLKEQKLYKVKEKQRKQRIRKREEGALFNCEHMLLTTLRRTPCLWFYYLCPNLYPQCLHLLTVFKNLGHMCLFLLAVVCWTPGILFFELLRGVLCCLMCTG